MDEADVGQMLVPREAARGLAGDGPGRVGRAVGMASEAPRVPRVKPEDRLWTAAPPPRRPQTPQPDVVTAKTGSIPACEDLFFNGASDPAAQQ
jgi:hypothetical protein